jgi:hypothetical protein
MANAERELREECRRWFEEAAPTSCVEQASTPSQLHSKPRGERAPLSGRPPHSISSLGELA